MYQVYQIQKGENLESVAQKLNISLEELKKLNGIGENIKEGSFIIIPNKMKRETKYRKYIIKKGDTLYSVARNNNVDLDTLIRLNGLNKDDFIYENEEILIPNNNMYITKENDKVKDILSKNIDIDKIGELIVKEDQIIMY